MVIEGDLFSNFQELCSRCKTTCVAVVTPAPPARNQGAEEEKDCPTRAYLKATLNPRSLVRYTKDKSLETALRAFPEMIPEELSAGGGAMAFLASLPKNKGVAAVIAYLIVLAVLFRAAMAMFS